MIFLDGGNVNARRFLFTTLQRIRNQVLQYLPDARGVASRDRQGIMRNDRFTLSDASLQHMKHLREHRPAVDSVELWRLPCTRVSVTLVRL
jgi:hypothetical protein